MALDSTTTTTASTPATAPSTHGHPSVHKAAAPLSSVEDKDDQDYDDDADDEFFLYFGFGSNLLKHRIRINSPSATLIGVGRLRGYQLGFTGWNDNWQGGVANIFSADDQPSGHGGKCNPLVGLDSEESGESGGGCDTCIWGAVWKIDKIHLPCLDEQEGVSYTPFDVNVDLFDCCFGVPPEWKELPAFIDEISSEPDDRTVLRELVAKIKALRLRSSPSEFKPLRTISVRAYKKVKDSELSPGNTALTLPSDSYLLVILIGAVDSGLPYQYVEKLASLLSNFNISIFRDWRHKWTRQIKDGCKQPETPTKLQLQQN